MMSMDDENTPMQEEDDETEGKGEQIGDADSSQEKEVIPTESGEADHITVKRKKTNDDYRKKKSMKCHTHVSIGYQEAIITGNPQNVLARVEVVYDVGMGVSVFVKGKAFHKGDYITHYGVKRTMTVEGYTVIYTNKSTRRPHYSAETRIICITSVKRILDRGL